MEGLDFFRWDGKITFSSNYNNVFGREAGCFGKLDTLGSYVQSDLAVPATLSCLQSEDLTFGQKLLNCVRKAQYVLLRFSYLFIYSFKMPIPYLAYHFIFLFLIFNIGFYYSVLPRIPSRL